MVEKFDKMRVHVCWRYGFPIKKSIIDDLRDVVLARSEIAREAAIGAGIANELMPSEMI